MSKKYEYITATLLNPPKTSANLLDAEKMFETASQMDDGTRDGMELVRQWLECDTGEEAIRKVDVLSTAALSMTSLKHITERAKNLPEALRSKALDIEVMREMAKMDKEKALECSLYWIQGFLLGIAFHKYEMASPDEES